MWYRVQLPYANNQLAVQYCGTTTGIGTVGLVYYDLCDDCENYHIAQGYVWNACSAGRGLGIDMWWDNVAGPGYVYVPAYVVDASLAGMEFVATFHVKSIAPGPVTNAKRPMVKNSAKAAISEVKPAVKLSR